MLKVINAASDTALARDLQQAAAADPSLVLIDRYLARPDLNALLQAAAWIVPWRSSPPPRRM